MSASFRIEATGSLGFQNEGLLPISKVQIGAAVCLQGSFLERETENLGACVLGNSFSTHVPSSLLKRCYFHKWNTPGNTVDYT